MLTSNTLRFCTDIFGALKEEAINKEQDGDAGGETVTVVSQTTSSFESRAFLRSSLVWDCTNKIAVTGFDITVFEPSETAIRLMFRIGDKYGTLGTSGEFIEYTGEITAKNVLEYGNSPAELSSLLDVPSFVGQKIRPIIALRRSSATTDLPSIKIGINVISSSNVVTHIEESDSFVLSEEAELPRIISITPTFNCTGAGEVTVKVSLCDVDDNWTAFMDLVDAADQEAKAVKFRFVYKVDTPNSIDSASVRMLTITHTYGKMIVSGEDADLYTVVQNYDIPLQMCHVTVRHSPLTNSRVVAFVNFMHKAKQRELLQIGSGTGATQELVLGTSTSSPDLNIDTSTIRLFANSTPISNFSYNSETSTVTLKATKNAVIFASYDYDHDVEVWKRMTLDVTEPYNNETGDCVSRFTYALSDAEAEDKVISNVRVVVRRPTGTVTNLDLGYGTKKTQLFILPHIPKAASITFTDSSVSYTYDEDTNTLAVVAKTTTPLIVSYKWQGEPVTVTGISCGWSVA